MKKISKVFVFLAIILTIVMCVVVAYNYCSMRFRPGLTSAPAWVAFLLMIPYGMGILVCLIVAIILKKKEK